jgi:hypothetical protein
MGGPRRCSLDGERSEDGPSRKEGEVGALAEGADEDCREGSVSERPPSEKRFGPVEEAAIVCWAEERDEGRRGR